MADIFYDEVPSLDLADFTGNDPARKKTFVADLGAAYHNIGFVAVRNHYLTDDLSARDEMATILAQLCQSQTRCFNSRISRCGQELLHPGKFSAHSDP